ncbi:MAG: hypothetical protein QMC28_02270 [Flavobacteriales bacterium]
MKKIALVFLLNLVFSINFGQKSTVSGTIKDSQSGEDLISATVFVEE